MKNMIKVVLESPFAGDVEKNLEYARAAMRDCLKNHNEAPIASHLLYTQKGILNDDIGEERGREMEKDKKCRYCDFCGEYYRYKTRRKDGNDCMEMICDHPKMIRPGRKNGKSICTYRLGGSLRLGKDTMIKTRPRWCPLLTNQKECV